MPLPESLGPINRRFVKPVLGPLARWIRPFAVVTHHGRITGKPFDTVVWAFERDGTVAIALTYGTDVDWVKNLLAAGRGRMMLGGEELALVNPRVAGDDSGAPFMPAPVRATLRALDVHDYLLADRV